MNEQQPSAAFGLNFLQDAKGDSDAVTGAYDPEQELWLEQVQGGALLADGLKGVLPELKEAPSSSLITPPHISTPKYTTRHTSTTTPTGSGPKRDTMSDGDSIGDWE